MAFPALAVAGGMALLGGIAGAAGNNQRGSSSGSSVSTVGLRNFENINAGASGLENAAYQGQLTNFGDLSRLVDRGPGLDQVLANNQFQGDFANQLQQLLGNINNQSSSQIQSNYGEAQRLFAPQQESLNQQFVDMNTDANRLSARLGRAGNDPILRNKLFQEQSRQQRSLDAQVGSYATQLPEIQANRVMQLGGTLSNLRQGLATQALANRQTLLGLGNELANSERNYRLQTADRTNNTSQSQSQSSGGGFSGFLSGALAGASGGLQVAQGFNKGGNAPAQTGGLRTMGPGSQGFGSAGGSYSNFGGLS